MRKSRLLEPAQTDGALACGPPPPPVVAMSKAGSKHKIADVFDVGSPVSTQQLREYVGDAVSAQTLSRLTDKILSRPPVKFIFNTVLDILKTTGYDKDLMERLESRGIATKNDRTAVVQMMSDAMTAAANYSSPLIIPAKICAGKQVDRTRLLLAVFGHVALGNEGTGSSAARPAVRCHSSSAAPWRTGRRVFVRRTFLRDMSCVVFIHSLCHNVVLLGKYWTHACTTCALRVHRHRWLRRQPTAQRPPPPMRSWTTRWHCWATSTTTCRPFK